MISDIREQPDGHVFDADVCLIGGGAAAIAMALRLAGSALNVLIFESGGDKPDAEVKQLAAGSGSGIPYFSLDDSRVRTLGGSTYRWGARSAPMNDIDHVQRDWVPLSGWPIGPEALRPFHADVHEMIGLKQPFAYDASVFEHFRAAPPAIDPDALQFTGFQFGKKLMFGEAYAPELVRAPNVHAYLHACVSAVQLSSDHKRIEEATIRTLDGKRFSVRARRFVLACGGIENARLLLNWGNPDAGGLCNGNDLVGRTFMEHPTLTAGVVQSDNWQLLCDVFSPGLVDGRFVETGLAPSTRLQQSSQMLNAVARIRPVVSEDATQALREILWNARHRQLPTGLGWYRNEWLRARLGAILRDPLSIPLNIVRHLRGKPKRFRADSVILELRTEQAPNPDSRVSLSRQTDALGLFQAHLHWAMTPLDKHTMRVMASTMDAELRRLGLGSIDFHPWLDSSELVWSDDLVGGHHHMGTTRMSDDPASGVVDRNCKAHAIDNLYIAGSSVFPTASYVNPTFTVLCLALRLADHLLHDGSDE